MRNSVALLVYALASPPDCTFWPNNPANGFVAIACLLAQAHPNPAPTCPRRSVLWILSLIISIREISGYEY